MSTMSISVKSRRRQRSDSVIERTLSPFDHRASYVPLPTFTPSVETAEPAENPAPKSGHRHLAEALNHHIGTILDRDAHLLRRGAIRYIEKLTPGKWSCKTPQCMSESAVRRNLLYRVPEKYFLRCGWSKSQIHTQSWTYDDVTARAAAEYITHLKSDTSARKNRIAEYKREINKSNGKVNASTQGPGGQEAVETVLKKIETWCESWLEGKIYEADWDRMEECL